MKRGWRTFIIFSVFSSLAFFGNYLNSPSLSHVEAAPLPQEVLSKDVLSKDVLSKDVLSKDVLSKDVLSKDVLSKDVLSQDVSENLLQTLPLPVHTHTNDHPHTGLLPPKKTKTNLPTKKTETTLPVPPSKTYNPNPSYRTSSALKLSRRPPWPDSGFPDGIPFPERLGIFVRAKCAAGEDIGLLTPKRMGSEAFKKSWQYGVNDKLGSYLYALEMGVRSPAILWCGTKIEELTEWSRSPPADLPAGGFVVKRQPGGDGVGVYVLESGFGGVERLSGDKMSAEKLLSALKSTVGKKGPVKSVHVEEIVEGVEGDSPPSDWKFYMFAGKVGGLSLTTNKGLGERVCRAWFDKDFRRVDEYGCFLTEGNTNKRKGQDKVHLCSAVAKPPQFEEMVAVAEKLGASLGTFMRVDLFIASDGGVVLGEMTPNPFGGKMHCIGMPTGNPKDPVDGCVMGKMWKDMESELHFSEVEPPAVLDGWTDLNTRQRCERVKEYAVKIKG